MSELLLSVFALALEELIFSFGILFGDIFIIGPCFGLGFPKIIFFFIIPVPGFGDLFPFFISFIFLFTDDLLAVLEIF